MGQKTMFIRILEDGSQVYPYSLRQAKRDFKHVSFGADFSENGSPDLGVFRVMPTERPGDPVATTCAELPPVRNGGLYFQQWSEPVAISAADLQRLRDGLVSRVKAAAGRRIVTRMPEWKQRNYLAFSLDMTRGQLKGRSEKPEDSQKMDFIGGEWAWAQAVRDVSNALEVMLTEMPIEEAINYDIENHPEWPE